jgi:glycogen synthase
MQTSAMRQDFGWHRSAEAYANPYRSLFRLPGAREAPQSELPTRLIA